MSIHVGMAGGRSKDEQGRAAAGELQLVVKVLTVVVSSYLLLEFVLNSWATDLNSYLNAGIEAAVIASVTIGSLWHWHIRGLRDQHRKQHFEQQLHTALQMARTEAAGYGVIERALRSAGVEGRHQVMMADSSEAHLKSVVDTPDAPVPGCEVSAPFDCPAINHAQTMEFPSSFELDACPYLIQRNGVGELNAVCVPLNVVGRSIGVLHVLVAGRRNPEKIDELETIAEQAGTRIGLLRVMEQTHLQAATDPLTGLLNRRSVENELRALMARREQFILAMGDLDHFKQLNDTHGHDMGDRAIRAFARAVRGSLRSQDIASRYGGEEFVFVFPGRTTLEAAGALERIQENLALAAADGSTPPFTVSFGVANSKDADSIEDLIRLADATLYRAKRQGRNRVLVDGSDDRPS